MATINYNGMELEELNPDKSVSFNPPIKCVGWNNKDVKVEFDLSSALSKDIWIHRFIGTSKNNNPVAFMFCAILPDPPKPRRATWEQLAYWLIDGKGLVIDTETNRVDTGVFFSRENMHKEVGERWKVMKRNDSEWYEPTVDYMELEEDK